MKQILTLILFCTAIGSNAQSEISYEIDPLIQEDTFFVKANIPFKLSKSNNTYQFAATAPGTYQTQNIGRFISDFKAYQANGKEIKTKHIAPNQYVFAKPKKVKSISFKAAETFDTKVSSFPVYMMCGSSIESDHVLLNTHTVLGYISGKQSEPIKLKLLTKPEWMTGSALTEKDGYFWAESYDHLVDSPILSGKLTLAETSLSGTPIKVFTYSEKDKLQSKPILNRMTEMLGAAEKFLVKLPVDQYTFLYFFMQNPSGVTGAWEHSYSSEYVMGERDPNDAYLSQVADIASHEFFHIVTPLNIHSEIIEKFNFVEPTPSQHLWLYEGVTEWASNMLLYRGGVVPFEKYVQKAIAQKINVDERFFSKEWSLAQIAEKSFQEDGAKQYGNIYYRGSLVAGLLDIRLLELSNGKRGLRELILDLVKKYGKGNPVSEKTFFNDLVAMTHPEIADFIEKYIKNAEQLPHEEYLEKIGLKLKRENNKIEVVKIPNPTDEQQLLLEAWSKNLPY